MLNKTEKDGLIEGLKKELDGAAGVLFLDFTGITVDEANTFRRRLQQSNVHYQVVKNTLVKRALAGRNYESVGRWLSGSPTGVVIGRDDPVQSAKAVFDFMGECKHLRVKGGVVENNAINAAQAEGLSKMPSKGEIQASIVSLALSPGRKLAGQIQCSGSRILGAVEALVEKLEKSDS